MLKLIANYRVTLLDPFEFQISKQINEKLNF